MINCNFSSSPVLQRVYPSIQQAVSFTTHPFITSTTCPSWRSSRKILSATSPERLALRRSWEYDALKVIDVCYLLMLVMLVMHLDLLIDVTSVRTAEGKGSYPLSIFLNRFPLCSRSWVPSGLSIHTFHGNFFVRSTDLLSLANVNPDSAFAVQMSIDDSLADSSLACFQAALLYTSSKGTHT